MNSWIPQEPVEAARYWWQHIDIWLQLVATVGCFILSLSVFRNMMRGGIYRKFVVFTAALAFWGLTNFSQGRTSDPETALFLTRLGRVFSLWLPLLFYNFYLSFTRNNRGFYRTVFKIGIPLFTLLSGACLFSDKYIHAVGRAQQGGRWLVSVGPLYFVQVLTLAILVVISHYLLIRFIITTSSRVEKNRAKYLLIATVALTLPALIDSFGFIGWHALPPLLPFGMTVFCFTMFWGIYRRRLLDLDFAVKRVLVALLLLASSYLIFKIVLTGATLFFHLFHLENQKATAEILSLLAALVFFHQYMPGLGEAAFSWLSPYRNRYTRDMNQLTGSVYSFLTLEALLENLMGFLKNSMELKNAAFFLPPRPAPNAQSGVLQWTGLGNNKTVSLKAEEWHFFFPQKGPAITTTDDLDRRLRTHILQSEELAITTQVLKKMGTLQVDLAIPLVLDKEPMGLLCLGAKPTGVYDRKDVQGLGTLGKQLAGALKNLGSQRAVKEGETLATMGTMAGNVAHEIKNPLGAIHGAAQYLKDSPLSGQERRFAGIILEESDRLNRTLQSFLQFSRPLTLNLNGAVPDDILQECIHLSEIEKTFSQIEIKKTFTADPMRINLDRDLIKQVFLNLIRNACQSMENKGELTVTSQKIVENRNPLYRADIEDNGPGIPQKVQIQMFTPFFTTRTRGSGLGLSLSRKIIELHKGKLTFATRPGKTTFSVFLPI